MAIRLNSATRNKIVDIVTAYLSGTDGTAGSVGMLRIYSGAQPGTAGGTAGVLLVTIEGLAWSAATGGTAVLAGTYSGTSATTGTAGWGRLSGTDGSSYIIDGDCGEGGVDFVIDNAAIEAELSVTLQSASIIQPDS
jgi:hypothetical protein